MPTSGRERKQRQKQRKQEARQNGEALEGGDTGVAKSPPGDVESSPYVSKDFGSKDLRYWYEQQRTPTWELKPEHFKSLPETFAALALGKKIEDGQLVDDFDATPATQAAAGRILVQMAAQLLRQSQQQFSVHKHYTTRHSHAETPEPDAESTSTEEVVEVSFREKVSVDESEAVLADLQELGLLGVFLGVEREAS